MAITKALLGAILTTLGCVEALKGGTTDSQPIKYMAGAASALLSNSSLQVQSSPTFSRTSYQYTGYGTGESNIFFTKNGSLIFSPAYSAGGVGYAISHDDGQTWSQVLPGGADQPRAQPVMAVAQDRQFFWSSNMPGLLFSYSDDEGKTWKLLSKHLMSAVGDWVKMIEAPPVYSKLEGGASALLYLSAPSNLSTPFPIASYVMKSKDRGSTWQMCPGQLPLQPAKNGGACAGKDNNEVILWGAGIGRKNGTVMIGLRHCTKLGIAVTNDEGNTWKMTEVPGSDLPKADGGILAYAVNGNMVMPDPISQDSHGNIYGIWSDVDYVLKMSRSNDDGTTWSTPVEIAAPLMGTKKMMTYLPKMRHHPTIPGRAAVAYYGSLDKGVTWHAYIAETNDIAADKPVFTSIQASPSNAPMQKNTGGGWDQGYLDPLWDLVEFLDVDYSPKGQVVGSFARKMCEPFSTGPEHNPSVCADGWAPGAKAGSMWQGTVFTIDHA